MSSLGVINQAKIGEEPMYHSSILGVLDVDAGITQTLGVSHTFVAQHITLGQQHQSRR